MLNVSQTWAALVKATGFYIKGCFALVNSPGDFSFFLNFLKSLCFMLAGGSYIGFCCFRLYVLM